MSSDYLRVEYDEAARPLTTYPQQLGTYLAEQWGIGPGSRLLDVAAGRAEVSGALVSLGVNVTCLDEDVSAEGFATKVGADFVRHMVCEEKPMPFDEGTFDVVYTKSFIEHLTFPVSFLRDVNRILRPGGLALMLTPDWESNYRIFFDDVTHKTPFTATTLRQAIELAGMECLSSRTFRQLPLTWRSPAANQLARIVAPFVPVRATLKPLRWSRELMVCGVGQRRVPGPTRASR